jgi:cystathionine beta-synthase
MPVIKHEPPIVLAEVVGAVSERELMDCVFADSSMLDREVSDVMGKPLPTIGAGEQVQVAVGRLEAAPALLVLDRGHPIGVVTRSDVLATLATASR